MMSEKGSSASTSLAITEKRSQRSGGCIGIFFQLFDWNRRLAKKKLFSKKLLPPARAKRASQKFGGDDNLPMGKLLLIADENRGGFPKKHELDNVDSERAHEMRSPSLVARLMGLESIPAARRSKPKKGTYCEYPPNHEIFFGSNHNVGKSEAFGCNQEKHQFEKGHMKLDSRPQKLQKTGLFERRPVTRFGAEALQFKGALSRSRKHHSKLASPVKSPRVGRNATRLMEAATKILEPGLNAAQRPKCALTYSPNLGLSHQNEDNREGKPFVAFDHSEPSNYKASVSKPLKGQPSCKRCGNWLDVMDRRLNMEEKAPLSASSPFRSSVVSPQGLGRGKVKPNVTSIAQERAADVLRTQERFVSFGAESRVNVQKQSKRFTGTKSEFLEDQDQYRLSSQRTKSQKDVASITVLKQRSSRQSQVPFVKDRGSPSPKFGSPNYQRDSFNVGSVQGSKDFVASNRNSICKTKARMPSKVSDNCKSDIEGNTLDMRDDSPSRLRASVRKRRQTNGKTQVENRKFTQFHSRKQRDVGGDVIVGKAVESSASTKNHNCVKTELPREKFPRDRSGDAAGGRMDSDVISFTFSSPMRHITEVSSPTSKKTGDQRELMYSDVVLDKELTSNSNSGKPTSYMATRLSGDALGALLEEKLRELTFQDRDESETGDAPSGKSTASILEELIIALTGEKSSSQDNEDNCSINFSQDDNMCSVSQDPLNGIASRGQMFNASRKDQGEAKSPMRLVGFSHVGESEQPSPGSVLEASFSNDSCFSESLDDCSGYRLHQEAVECSYDQLQHPDNEAYISDSAAPLSTGIVKTDENHEMTYSLNNISSVLYGIDPADIGLEGSELNHAWEVIVDAELLLGSLCGAHSSTKFSIGSLLDKLENLSDAVWANPKCNMGFTEAKTGQLLRRFLFDCVIECLDKIYGDYCRSRFTVWPKLPLQTNGESLIQEVHEEAQSWASLAGKTIDDIIEKETLHSLGKWTEFETEVFESGMELEWDILQVLVDEVVIDLRQCRSVMVHWGIF